jgi:hypothetical protein
MRENERGENDPVYMQQDGNQENANRRCFGDIKILQSDEKGKREREGPTWL